MDWKATFAEIAAERRKEGDGRPSTDEMLALQAGELSDAERERLLERASWDPAVARELLELVRFPELPDGGRVATDPGQDRRWQAMHTKLLAEGILPGLQKPSAPSGTTGRSRAWWAWRAWWPLTASFAAGMALAIAIEQLRSPARSGSPGEAVRVNLPIVELLALSGPADAGRRGGEVSAFPPGADGLVLTLAVPGLAPVAGSLPYDLEIRRGREVVSRSQNLVPGAGGVFVLFLPRDRLMAGAHDLLLRDGGGRPVARFRLEVEQER